MIIEDKIFKKMKYWRTLFTFYFAWPEHPVEQMYRMRFRSLTNFRKQGVLKARLINPNKYWYSALLSLRQ